jgi:transposase
MQLRWTRKFEPVVKLCIYGGYGMGLTTQTPENQVKVKRKRHDPQFKARVALEAIKGIKTVQQIAKEQEDFSSERTDLHSKIGELTVMLDYAVRKSKQLGEEDVWHEWHSLKRRRGIFHGGGFL